MIAWKNGSSSTTATADRWHRPHSSLGGKTPIDIVVQKSALTPFSEDIEAKYDPDKEPIREQSIWKEKALRKLKRVEGASK